MNYIVFLPLLLLLNGQIITMDDKEQERKALAERYFRGIYECNLSVIDELAAEDIIVSYPIFETLINTPTNQGREAVKEFHESFCRRWMDAELTIHESVAEGNTVVLVWSFSARNKASFQRGDPVERQYQSWGGISVFHFDDADKIIAEYGEESQPGPFRRVENANPQRNP